MLAEGLIGGPAAPKKPEKKEGEKNKVMGMTQGEKDVRLTAPVIAEYDEELSAGEIIMTNASGRSVRQGRRIVYEHLPFQSDQSYTLQIVGVRDTCGCTIK
jgi:hypothetical protein